MWMFIDERSKQAIYRPWTECILQKVSLAMCVCANVFDQIFLHCLNTRWKK